MGKLLTNIKKQESGQDKEDVLKLYKILSDLGDGRVWSSEWSIVVSTSFIKNDRYFKATPLGQLVILGKEHA